MASEVSNVSDADFTFKATYAYPTGYRQIYLSPFYDVKVSPDTVRVYLPYYGRAYVALSILTREESNSSAPISIISSIPERKGNWRVAVRTKDTGREITLNFDIWENGTVRLHVSDPNRQSISFNGKLTTASQPTP